MNLKERSTKRKSVSLKLPVNNLAFYFPTAILEYRFAPLRKWRFDAAWISEKVALEVEGAIWTQGRHTRGQGYLNDMEKYSEAAILGWRVLRVTWKQVKNGEAQQLVSRCLASNS